MNIQGQAALVTGGGSGLGEATARELARLGAKVAVLDLNLDNAERVAKDIGGVAIKCNVSDPDSMAQAIEAAAAAHGPARILMQIAGIGSAKRVVGKDGNAAPLEDFIKVVNVNLIGTYNAARLFAAACAKLDPMEDGERGAMVFTASVAAFDGQVGQQAYSASKGGVVGMTLPMARDLAQHGIRVCTIAPGLFSTPLMKTLPEPVQQSLAASIPFPARLGKPEEFAELACHIVSNGHLNGEVIRLDGALRHELRYTNGKRIEREGVVPDVPVPQGRQRIEGSVRSHATRVMQLGEASAVKPGAILQNVDPGGFAAASGLHVHAFIIEQLNDTHDGLVRDWPAPSAGVDKHRGYAFQWYALAAVAFLFYLITGIRSASKRNQQA